MKQIGDHVKGPVTAPVTLLMYGDFQCPYSAEAIEVVDDVLKTYRDKVRFIFRHFPLVNRHEYALSAALAAEAAGMQKKFWAMYRALFRNQVALDRDSILQLAEDIDLDLEEFEQDFDSERTLKRVQRGLASGERSGVDGTPTFFVNDVKYEGALDFESMADAVEEALRGKLHLVA